MSVSTNSSVSGVLNLTSAQVQAVQALVSGAGNITVPGVRPVNYAPIKIGALDETHYYGPSPTNATQLVKIPKGGTDATPVLVQDFGATVRRVFRRGRYWVAEVIAHGSDVSDSVWISLDGVTYTKRLTLGVASGYTGASVLMLADTSFCVATVNGVETLLIGEYNISTSRTDGGANDRLQIWRSVDGGVSWESIATWNTSGHQTRHIHVIQQDPVSKWVYVSFGDSDTESGLVAWDGVTAWPSNTAPSAFDGLAGFKAGPGVQRGRVCDFVFTPDWIYTAGDVAQNGRSRVRDCGIWRYKRDFSQAQRVSTHVLRHLRHVMMFGRQDRRGRQVWCSGVETLPASGDRYFVVYTSSNGEQWDAVARCTLVAGTTGVLPYQLLYDEHADNFIIQGPDGAGKSDSWSAIFALTDEQWTGVEPDSIHPVYWVGPGGIDDTAANRGLYPHIPFATLAWCLNNASNSNKITFGGAVWLPEGVTEVDSATVNTSGNSRAGESGVPFAVIGYGRDRTRVLQPSTGAGAQVLQYNTSGTPDHALKLRKLALDTLKPSPTQVLTIATATGQLRKLVVDDAVVGDSAKYYSVALASLRSCNVLLQNGGRMTASHITPSICKLENTGSGAVVTVADGGIIDGGLHNIYMRTLAGSAVIIKAGGLLSEHSTSAILFDSGATEKPTIEPGAQFICDELGTANYSLITGSTAFTWSNDYTGLRSNRTMTVTGTGSAFVSPDINASYAPRDIVSGDAALVTF